MRPLKYSILLANALLIACGDDNPVEGSRDNTIGNTESWQGQRAAAQKHDGGNNTIGNAESHWRGLAIRPESRCSPYERSDYPYSQSVEPRIADALGSIYSPYTGDVFENLKQTHIDHIVAMSEAHDSGLCAATAETRRAFAADLLNLTLTRPEVNGCRTGGKCAQDAAEWLPRLNKCWFADRVVAVRRKYNLTIDRREADALERVLATCNSTAMIGPADEPEGDPLTLWDDNGNGRITCEEARRHGIAPVPRNHPAYPFMLDGDGDGVVCE